MRHLLTLAALAALSAATAAPLTLTLSLTDGEKPFLYHQPLTVNGQALNVQDVRFYVSGVALVKDDGSEVPVEGLNLAKLNRGTPPRNIPIFQGDVPAGKYRGLRFDVGVPRELNHRDATTAPSPLSIEDGMYWAWNSGYIFFSLHGDVDGTRVAHHIGGDSHRITVDLADLQKPGTALNVGPAGLAVPLTLDLQKLYAAGAGGEGWDFRQPPYQQVHSGPVADQFFLNASRAFGHAAAPAQDRSGH
ncbi:hypothetical protein Deipr_0936 [Deinococcus proteolyticus MRP]|uniref:Copper-binding protein MbnP-like domain-containing protein n=1 Tax=Deinococcus proteolyticus (strain ATCC 35074 / DSM 20540 / JCM 6276 / NBRC 101906 / NCIMB 13154 / VKM Ac-1939 / CCM 2703 / MRP) TaxID=693977 RepID=F0RMV0_DEIPM|nr:MbnP family protein [Deinococcus proteolyticus]ADY26092.1 hypothetical protein Deipr_0936 [Deinococcus proteolyticus MRP]